jgi:hypothetical protein
MVFSLPWIDFSRPYLPDIRHPENKFLLMAGNFCDENPVEGLYHALDW